MKKRVVFAAILIIALLINVTPVLSADASANVGKEEIPYGDFYEGGAGYRYSSFDMMTEEEAKAAGVPEGYSGYVLKLTAESSGVGIGLDLTQYKVKDVESITFRVYCPATTKADGVRIGNSTANSWIMLANPGANSQWVEVVLSPESNFNTSEKSFDVFDDGNGYFKPVNFCFRFTGSNETGYIDSITVKLKDPDTVPPVITYNGPTVIDTTEGRDFVLDITAYDEYYEKYVTPEYIWSEGALDGNGKLVSGTHSCKVVATDPAGNSSEIALAVNVGAKDSEAPEISWTPESIVALVGSKPVFDVKATDNKDDVEAVLEWSEGALDKSGRLTAGEHTLTVSATDLTGNKTEKVINVSAVDSISGENIIQDTQ